MLVANVNEPGINYENLKETYVIFITENDVLKGGLPIYHIDRTIEETGSKVKNIAHIIYVNSQIQDETPLGKLMHDFYCTNADDMYYEVLADRAHYFKEDAKGVKTMSETMEKIVEEEKAEQNILTTLANIKNLMISVGWNVDQAMNALRISSEEREILLKRI